MPPSTTVSLFSRLVYRSTHASSFKKRFFNRSSSAELTRIEVFVSYMDSDETSEPVAIQPRARGNGRMLTVGILRNVCKELGRRLADWRLDVDLRDRWALCVMFHYDQMFEFLSSCVL